MSVKKAPAPISRRIEYFNKLARIQESIAEKGHLSVTQTRTSVYDQAGANELRLVLIGRTGEGKSATGNLILGNDVFVSKVMAKAVTVDCVMERTTFNERSLMVVDTPGLFDPERSNTEISKKILRFAALTAPGPHAFLLIISLGRQSPEACETYEYVEKLLGQAAHEHTIVVFTKKDELVFHKQTITDYLRDSPEDLEKLLKSVDNRYLAVNNRVDLEGSDRGEQVNALLKAIDGMLKKNNGNCFSSGVLTEADNALSSYTWDKDEQVLKRSIERASHVMSNIQMRAKELEELKSKGAVNTLIRERGEEFSKLVKAGRLKVKDVEAECKKELEEHRNNLRDDIADDKVTLTEDWFLKRLLKSAHLAFKNLFSKQASTKRK